MNINNKSIEINIVFFFRICDSLYYSQRAFPPLHKKLDIELNTREFSLNIGDDNS